MARFYLSQTPPGYSRDPWNRIAEEYHERGPDGRWIDKRYPSLYSFFTSVEKDPRVPDEAFERYKYEIDAEMKRLCESFPLLNDIGPVCGLKIVKDLVSNVDGGSISGRYVEEDDVILLDYKADKIADDYEHDIIEQLDISFSFGGGYLDVLRHELAHALVKKIPNLIDLYNEFLWSVGVYTANRSGYDLEKMSVEDVMELGFDNSAPPTAYAQSMNYSGPYIDREAFQEGFAIYTSPYYRSGTFIQGAADDWPDHLHNFFEELLGPNPLMDSDLI